MALKSKRKQSKFYKNKKSFPIWGSVIIALILLFVGVSFLNTVLTPREKIEVTGSPKIKVDQDYYDYGNVKNGGVPIRTSIKVSNIGDKPLNFQEAPYIELIEGCCPPVPSIGTLSLAPGESTQINVEFFMHRTMGGMHNFKLHLVTNDPAEPDKSITIISNWVD